MNLIFRSIALSLGFFVVGLAHAQAFYDGDSPVIRHGVSKLNAQLAASPNASEVSVFVRLDPTLGEEAFDQRRDPSDGGLIVVGGDERGAMYGLLDLADQLRLNGHDADALRLTAGRPHLPFRAVKFNTPWSAYRSHPAITQHWETCRDLAFWEAFLDMMAENRLNALSLWSLHPFTYMVRPEEFPESYSSISEEEHAEWRAFYTELFKMAKDRGIETYVVWWTIFVSPDFAKAHDVAEYSINLQFYGQGENNELVDRYNRACVTALINDYPDLTGVGVSLGERIFHLDAGERQQWIVDNVVAGIRDADRPVKFIHRAPFTGDAEVTRDAVDAMSDEPNIVGPILMEYKFNASHGHSSPRLHRTHGAGVNDAYWNPFPENHRMIWMMRNESFTALRWGQTDFIREHINNNSQDYVGGYFIGSETYVPAMAYHQRRPDPRIDWDYAFERADRFYRQWGRLLYDPDTPESVFTDDLRTHYGDAADALHQAQQLAGTVPLRISTFFAGNNDPSLTAEFMMDGARSRLPDGEKDGTMFIHMDEFIVHETLDPSWMNIADYAKRVVQGQPIEPGRTTPLDLAADMERDANATLALLDAIESPPGRIDYEIADARAWSHLAIYFAEKMRGGVALERFRLTGDSRQQDLAVAHLERALEHWTDLADVTDEVYPPFLSTKLIWLKQDGLISWRMFVPMVEQDIETARNAQPYD
ncbi:MAG: hypothetical protein AAGK09_00460 [Planctomycetota bacterium]